MERRWRRCALCAAQQGRAHRPKRAEPSHTRSRYPTVYRGAYHAVRPPGRGRPRFVGSVRACVRACVCVCVCVCAYARVRERGMGAAGEPSFVSYFEISARSFTAWSYLQHNTRRAASRVQMGSGEDAARHRSSTTSPDGWTKVSNGRAHCKLGRTAERTAVRAHTPAHHASARTDMAHARTARTHARA